MGRRARTRFDWRVRANGASGLDWRDSGAYAPLLDADRSLFAWEWLRRDPSYRLAAGAALVRGSRAPDDAAAGFGLARFEPPELAIPDARPLWRFDVHRQVLRVERGGGAASDSFMLDTVRRFATLHVQGRGEHLLLSDGLRAIRLDGPPGTFASGPACLHYHIDGLAAAAPLVLTLRRFLALCMTRRFARSLHPREARGRRWILMLRTWDALAAGADQRAIAHGLLSGSVAEPGWRSREPSLRSQAQRLVRSARAMAAGGFWRLLEPAHLRGGQGG